MNITHTEHSGNTDSSILNLFNSFSGESLSYNSSGYVMYNLDFGSGKYLFMSPCIKSLTGYSLSELNEIGFKSIVKEVYSNKMDRYKINGGRDLNVEEFYAKYLICTKSGEQKWLEDNSFAYLDKNSNQINSIGILRDTSALQIFIDSLNDEINNLDRIFDLSDTMLLQLDQRMNVVMINKKGCAILGGTKKEIIGKNLIDFIPEIIKINFNRYVKELVNEQEAVTKITQGKITSLDNKTKYIEWHNTVLRDKNGELVSLIASGQEITVKRQEEKIRVIITEILDEANSEKNIDELFKFIHKSINKLMKAENFYIAYYDQENNRLSFPYFVDKYEDEAFPVELGRGLTSYVFRKGKSVLLNQSQIVELVVKGITDVVGEMPKIWLGVPLKIKNKVIGVLVVQDYDESSTYTKSEQQILDVVAYPISRAIERKIMDAERDKMIVQLKELNKSKDQLFSLISHDLRTPFNSLLGFAEIITGEFDSLTRDEIIEYLNVINVSAKNLFGMTNNLFHYSRYQLGRYGYYPKEIKIVDAIERGLELQKYNIQNKKIHIIKRVNPTLTIWADEELINLVLSSIIENSIKFSHLEGTVSVSAEPYDENKRTRILISDEGTGITKENLERIERKEMFSTQGTLRESGAGLGVFLSRDFLEMNSGFLLINSEEKIGTTVTIDLPAKTQYVSI